MKEFEKWKDGNCVKVCNLCHIGVCGDCTGIGTKEDAWKAALRWVQNARFRSTDEPLNIDKPLYDMLEEELGIS